MGKNKHLRILIEEERQQIYALPKFTQDEQEWFFELTTKEQEVLKKQSSIETKIDAILQLGYFKAKQRLFSFRFSEVESDYHYIAKRYFERSPIIKKTIGRKARYNNQQWILSLFGYHPFNSKKHLPALLEKLAKVARISTDPSFIFQEALTWFEQSKIILAGYTTLQKLISGAIYQEQARIEKILNDQLSAVETKELLRLLNQTDGHYEITLLRKEPKNFKPKAIYKEIAYFEKHHSLYQLAKRLLPLLNISKNTIGYFASLVEHYTVQGLSRSQPSQTCLWLLCFLYHRYECSLNNLATMFIYTANQYKEEVAEKAKELLLINTLSDAEQKSVVAKLMRFYIDKNIDRSQPFNNIVKMAHAILSPEAIEKVAYDYENKSFNEKFIWEGVDELAKKYKPLLRAFIRVLPIEGKNHLALQQAFSFIKTTLAENKKLSQLPYEKFPKQLLNANIKAFILDEGKSVHTNRYEYYCYLQAAKYLDNKSLFINDSTQYRSFEAELVPDWAKDKNKIIHQIGNPKLSQSVEQFIEEKAKPLDKKIIEVNEAIQAGDNKAVKIKTAKDGSVIWTLPYTKKIIELNNPIYGRVSPTGICQVLNFVNRHTGFIQKFTHIKPHKAKSFRDELSIFACLIANGTNLGVGKMAEVCDLIQSELFATNQNFIRLSTLRSANEVISNAIAVLPIFRYWNFMADLLHASLDGQKFITERDTLLARYSPKYFGLMKGVVAYTLLANHIPLNVKIIGANQHESHHLFDLVYNNMCDVQPDIFSTDTEGSNQLNFFLLYVIDKILAPRYRSLSAKTESIISFSDPKNFKDYLIKPSKQINLKRLHKEDDNIKHILASLLLGETNQTNIISKLSSQQFSNHTKFALWDMNAVLMSDYLLDYIHIQLLRQSVQGSLNRGEAYHQLRRHISLVHGKHFRGSSEKEIAVWNECARLLANATIYYNATILTKLMQQHESAGDTVQANLVKQFSPVAWQHINFNGRYELLINNDEIDLDQIIKQLLRTNLLSKENYHLISKREERLVLA